MKIKELRALNKENLKSKLVELKKELTKHNAQIAIGTVPKSPGQIRDIKRTIARILTIVNELEIKKEIVQESKTKEKPVSTEKVEAKEKQIKNMRRNK